MMAASENDAPKVAELLRAGADASTRVRPCARALNPRLVHVLSRIQRDMPELDEVINMSTLLPSA